MSLYENINKRKKAKTSRSKKDSTISPESYANMKAGFPKKAKGGKVTSSKKDLKNIVGELKNASKMHLGQSKTIDKHLKLMNQGGKMTGPSHAKGGIPIEVEGDEYVIKKSSAKKIGYDNLDYMNEYGKIPTVDARKRSKKDA